MVWFLLMVSHAKPTLKGPLPFTHSVYNILDIREPQADRNITKFLGSSGQNAALVSYY